MWKWGEENVKISVPHVNAYQKSFFMEKSLNNHIDRMAQSFKVT